MSNAKPIGRINSVLKGRSGTFSRVLSYLNPHRKQFIWAMLCMVVFGATEGGLPFLIKYVLDGVFTDKNESLLYVFPIILISFMAFRALFGFLQEFLMSRVGHRIIEDIRNQLNRHLLSLSPDYFLRFSSGNILSRITSDVLLVKTLLTNSLSSVIRDIIRVIALLIAAIYLDPWLALIAFVAFPLGILPVYQFGKRMRKLSKKGQDAIGSISGLLQESINGNKVVKIFGREDFEQERFAEANATLTQTFIKSERVKSITGPVNEVLASLAISGVILYGGFSVIGGARTQGEFVAFLAALFLLYDPFKKLSRVHNAVQQGLSGAERIFEILDTQPTVQEVSNPIPLAAENSLLFDAVSYSYEPLAGEQRSEALSEITIEVPQGTKLALVGFSGAGKSTVVDLIPRFMDPQRGRILIGGVDIRQVSLRELRSRVAMVGQHTFLFHDTIYSNIAYGREGATKEEIVTAAKAAYAYDFIMALPEGFDTVIGESGLTLSGGERQRIAIARAVLKEAPILILDEATAALDNRSEREVQAALEALEQGKTSVIIAHRLSTVRNADQIIVLRDGQIVERGTHEELLRVSGEYAKLHSLQFSSGDDRESFEAVANR